MVVIPSSPPITVLEVVVMTEIQTDSNRKLNLSSSGLIRELAEAMLEDVNTHPEWTETLAACLVGMMMGKQRYMMNSLGEVYGNIFVIYVGASGLSFKTVPLKKVVRKLLKQLSKSVNEDVCKEVGMTFDEYNKANKESKSASKKEKNTNEWKQTRFELDQIGKKFVDYDTPQVFTSEKIASWLTEYPQGMICGDEYTKMFKGTDKKDYLADNMEMLSRLYDCDMEKVGTQSRGIEHPTEAYVAFASATTYYLLKLMGEDFFLQGTGNRILWILDDEIKELDVQKEMESLKFFWGQDKEIEYNNKILNLTQKLINIRHLPEGLVDVDITASAVLDRYRLEKLNQAIRLFSDDLINKDANLISRLAQNAMKLALVHCIGRYAMDERGTVHERMTIMQEDADWAVDKMERHFAYYKKMWTIAVRVREGKMKSFKDDQERVIYILDRLELKGQKLTPNILRQQTGWMRDECAKLLETMSMNGQIELVQEVIGGKPVTYYKKVDKNST